MGEGVVVVDDEDEDLSLNSLSPLGWCKDAVVDEEFTDFGTRRPRPKLANIELMSNIVRMSERSFGVEHDDDDEPVNDTSRLDMGSVVSTGSLVKPLRESCYWLTLAALLSTVWMRRQKIIGNSFRVLWLIKFQHSSLEEEINRGKSSDDQDDDDDY